jgi:hypothetical protein
MSARNGPRVTRCQANRILLRLGVHPLRARNAIIGAAQVNEPLDYRTPVSVPVNALVTQAHEAGFDMLALAAKAHAFLAGNASATSLGPLCALCGAGPFAHRSEAVRHG